MGFIKRFFGRQRSRVAEPLKDGRTTAKSLQTGLKSVIAALRGNRDPQSAGAPDLTDFKAVLRHWEIEPDQTQSVIRGLKIRTASFALLGIAGGVIFISAAINQKLTMFVSGIVLIALAVTALLTGIWRIQVLRSQTFVPFKDWIKTLLFGQKGA